METFCEHFRSQGWSARFLEKGYRTGLMGSSDGHYGNPGYGYLKPHRKELVGEGLIAVFAEEQTRPSIFHAMYDRSCYADTGDRIILEVDVDGHEMGTEYQSAKGPRIDISAAGSEKIIKVEILADNKLIKAFEPNQLTAEIGWKDAYFSPNEPRFYTVHVIQENGEEAISSPVWVN